MTLQKFALTAIGLAALIFISGQHTLAWVGPQSLAQQFTQTIQSAASNDQQQEVPNNQNDASLNWAGYVAKQSGTSYTSVTGTWTVPSVSTNTSGTADATWVGIGGVSSHDLIQAGTQAIVQDGQVSYSAWIETLPSFSKTVALDVHAGDSVTATLAEESEGQWLVTISNNTTGKNYSQTIRYNSSRSSAEWIEEMVSNGNGTFRPLDSFGSVSFTNAAATANGQSQNISALGAESLQMVNGAEQVLASVSSATDSGFTVSRNSASTGSPDSLPVTVTIVRHHHHGFSYGYSSIQGIPFFTIRLY